MKKFFERIYTKIYVFFVYDVFCVLRMRIKGYFAMRKKYKGFKLDKAEMTKNTVKSVFKHFATPRVLAIYRTVPYGVWQIEYKFRGSELGKEYAYVDDKTGKLFFNHNALHEFLREEGREKE